jgi:cyclophilin family peptidyl-prolyl cis-trans isomerase
MTSATFTEVLESRIAPALVVVNPIPDILVGGGSSGKTIELSQMFDATIDHPGHTIVTFTLNFDSDPSTPGIQLDTDPATPGDQLPQIKLELFDDQAPLTVQNFLRYLEGNSAEFINSFFHRSVSNFVLQGGGFAFDPANPNAAKDIDEHIDTFSTVHNEFSATRSNLRGTIAMAKVETNENTASSEWFVNLANNSANLDNQNGGFTVFGQVIEGMDLIDKIAALPKANLGGALTDVPVQNYDPDPDHRPGTPPPIPKADNLIRITGIDIAAPEVGSAPGISYVVEVSGNAEIIDSALINGSNLQLTYDPIHSGVATVKVTASRGSGPDLETAVEEFTVTLRPNLIGTVSKDGLQKILLPGEGGIPLPKKKNEVQKYDTTKFTVQNNGGANFDGNATIEFYFSSVDGQGGDDQFGSKLNTNDDILVLSLPDQHLVVTSGGEIVLPEEATSFFLTHFKVGDSASDGGLIPDKTDDYRLIVKIVPAEGTSQQLFTDDDVAVDGGTHVLTNSFGTLDFGGFGKRTDVELKYKDPVTNQPVTLSLKGPGIGEVTLDEGSSASGDEKAELLIRGTTQKSQFIVGLDQKGKVAFSQVEVNDFMKLVDLTNVDKLGNVSLSSGAEKVILGDFIDDQIDTHLTIGKPPKAQPISISLGIVNDFSIESLQPIKLLQAVEWHDKADPDTVIGGVNDSIKTPSLASLKITGGDLEADLETSTVDNLSSISVFGSVKNAKIHTLGDIGKFTAAKLDGATVITPTKLVSLAIADSVVDSTIQVGSIGKITVDGLATSSVSANAELSSLLVEGTVDHSTIHAGSSIGKVTADKWTDSDLTAGAGLASLAVNGEVKDAEIRANSIGRLTVVAPRHSDVSVVGELINATIQVDTSIGKFIADKLTGSQITAGSLTSISVTDLVTTSTIRTTGDIGKVTVGGMTKSSVFAGTDARPDDITDFDSIQKIGSFTIKESKGVTNIFAESQVAAATIGKITVRGVDTASGTDVFGFVADKVAKYSRSPGPTFKNLDAAATKDSVGNYQLLILAPPAAS